MKDIVIRKIQDPVNAFVVDREVREIKQVLQNLPIYTGKGSPEGELRAKLGSLYLNVLGGTSAALYVKETGEETSTGWVAK